MQVVPPALERLIQDLNRLPGIGKKTATRLALHIMRGPAEEARNLASDLAELHSAVKLCSSCFIFSETDPCKICSDASRNDRIVCVVEGPDDLLAKVAACIAKIAPAVVETAGAQAYNVLCNNGRAAGQLVEHVHFHVIPRNTDDGVFNHWPAGEYQQGQAENIAADIRSRL